MPGNQQQAQKSAADTRRERAKLLKSKRLKARKYRVKEVVNLDTASSIASYTVKDVKMKTSTKTALDMANSGLLAMANSSANAAANRAATGANNEMNRAFESALGSAQIIGALRGQARSDFAAAGKSIEQNAVAMMNAGLEAVANSQKDQQATVASASEAMQAGFAAVAALENQLALDQQKMTAEQIEFTKGQIKAEQDKANAVAGQMGADFAANMEQFNKDFAKTQTDLAGLFQSWKGMDFRAMGDLFRDKINKIIEMIKPCPGEEMFKIYWCNEHMVFCEKTFVGFDKPDNSDKIIIKRSEICYKGIVSTHFETKEVINDMPLPGICCEGNQTSWESGWASKDEISSGKPYKIYEWPASVCNALLEMGMTFGSVVLDNEKSQSTRQKNNKYEDPKFKSDEVRAMFIKHDEIMKLYFVGDPKVRMAVVGGDYKEIKEGSNDYIDFMQSYNNLMDSIGQITDKPGSDEEKLILLKELATTHDFDLEDDEISYNDTVTKLQDELGSKYMEISDNYAQNFRKALATLIMRTAESEARKRLIPGYCEKNVAKK